MPYIKQVERVKWKQTIDDTVEILTQLSDKQRPGEMNYFISTVLERVYNNRNRSYSKFNEAVGVLESVKQEFYRKKVGKYEDGKEKENGGVE